MKRALSKTLITAFAFGSLWSTGQAQAPSPWGLRNIETLNGSIQLPHFTGHGAGFSHGWTLWNDIEPSQGVYNWTNLDDRIDTALALNSVPIVLLHMNAPWVQTCPSGMECPNPNTGPYDLVTEPDPVTAFSPILYQTTQALVGQIATKYPTGDLYLRFHNEPFDDWVLGSTESEWTTNIKNYERCLRTFRKAARDKAAALGGGLNIMVSHGGQPRFRQFSKYLYEWGDAGNEATKAEARNWANFLFERQIGNGVTDPFPTWGDFVDHASLTGSNAAQNLRYDFWLTYHYQWAKDAVTKEIIDFEDMHPHGKPLAVLADRALYTSNVTAIGGTPLPVFAIEAAIQVGIEDDWAFYDDLDFQAEDFVRKWMTFMRVGDIGFCSPVIGKPSSKYKGLLDGAGNVALPADTSFKFFANRINPVQVIKVSEGLPGLTHYRIVNDPSLDTIVDAVWYAALRDNDTATTSTVLPRPVGGFNQVEVFDALGQSELLYPAPTAPTQIVLDPVEQAPKVVIWSRP